MSLDGRQPRDHLDSGPARIGASGLFGCTEKGTRAGARALLPIRRKMSIVADGSRLDRQVRRVAVTFLGKTRQNKVAPPHLP